MHIFKNTKFDFLRWRYHALALSWLVIIAGVATLMTKGLPRGAVSFRNPARRDWHGRGATVESRWKA